MKTKLVIAAIASTLAMPLLAADSFSPYVDGKGQINLPKNFRSDLGM